MVRTNVSSGTEWENLVGYSRAVRLGNAVHVAGTTAVDQDGQIVCREDPYGQTLYILNRIESALAEVGCGMADVVRTRMYVTDISTWEDVGRAHGEFFRDIRPAATMVEVQALIHPDLLVEIEVDAIAG